jgi:diguanylate cyclase (GGDEF)-like protein
MSDEHETTRRDTGFDDDEGTVAVSPDMALSLDLGAPTSDAYLTVIAGSRVGEMVKLVAGDLTIGRGLTAGFRINDPGASKEHVRVTLSEDGTVRAIDLGSRNGTRVNGEPISEVALADGDKLQVGAATIFRFAHADAIDESFQQQMYEAAQRDTLTGLFNRRLLTERLEMEYSYALRNRTPLSFVMIDIDHFKRINDTHGHPIGDVVLRCVGQRLLSAVRREDFPARYGGEEFAILCRQTDVAVAKAVAERIRGMLECSSVVPEMPGLRVTLSAGVAGIPDSGIASALGLIEAADKALYAAKGAGRNRVCAFYDISRR